MGSLMAPEIVGLAATGFTWLSIGHSGVLLLANDILESLETGSRRVLLYIRYEVRSYPLCGGIRGLNVQSCHRD